MSDSEFKSHEQLREENAQLREEIENLRSRGSEGGGGKAQPIQGMMKLLKAKNQQIEDNMQKLRESNMQLRESYEQTVRYYKNTITALSSAMEAKDPFFQFHSSQVESISRKIGTAIGIDSKHMDILSTAALIHDFGNIGVRHEVIHKPGPLTEDELQHVRTHPIVASIILEPIGDFEMVITAIKYHHEYYDGTGYPEGLSGEEIPVISRIIFVAESYDAMVSARPYRQTPLTKEAAIQEITAHIGTRYDPAVVKAFMQVQA